MLKRGRGNSALLGHLKWCKNSSINSSTSASTRTLVTSASTGTSTTTTKSKLAVTVIVLAQIMSKATILVWDHTV